MELLDEADPEKSWGQYSNDLMVGTFRLKPVSYTHLTQKSIDTLNAKKVKVEADNTQLKELKDLLDKLNGAVNTKDRKSVV